MIRDEQDKISMYWKLNLAKYRETTNKPEIYSEDNSKETINWENKSNSLKTQMKN